MMKRTLCGILFFVSLTFSGACGVSSTCQGIVSCETVSSTYSHQECVEDLGEYRDGCGDALSAAGSLALANDCPGLANWVAVWADADAGYYCAPSWWY